MTGSPTATLRLPALLACALLLTAGCAGRSARPQADTATFVVVRHAEKASDDPRDPNLSAVGTAHAAALAQRLASMPLKAIYATQYRRTRQTAQPIATAHGVAVTDYDAAMPAAALAAQLRRDVARGGALVVGHSNTVPAIVSALCDCAVPAIDEATYGELYRVSIGADGRPVLVREIF